MYRILYLVFCYFCRVRFHYGHPDVFDRIFHITRGGISKASRGINLSEDIFAGKTFSLYKIIISYSKSDPSIVYLNGVNLVIYDRISKCKILNEVLQIILNKIKTCMIAHSGFNSTLRRGNVTHHEYIQVGKGRDVGLNQISLFEAKVACGNGEQILSRDIYRLGHRFDFFRMLSCYFTTVGFYVSSVVCIDVSNNTNVLFFASAFFC